MTRICSIPECGKPHHSHGFCGAHNHRFKRLGDPLASSARQPRLTCKIEGCGKRHLSRGWCSMHYRRWWIYGDPEALLTAAHGEAMEWLLAHVSYQGDGCLTWPFARNSDGYASLRYEGEQSRAHQVMCKEAHGERPSPLHEAAHSCGKGNEGCVHPGHLRWATHADNQADTIAHGTSIAGERHHNAKLTRSQAGEIYIRAIAGEDHALLAGEFGVKPSTISMIKTKRSWAILHRSGGADA